MTLLLSIWQRLQEGEARNQELSQSVTSATRPLLRQIENLQATLAAQTVSWEKLEKNLSDRLGKNSYNLVNWWLHCDSAHITCTESRTVDETQQVHPLQAGSVKIQGAGYKTSHPVYRERAVMTGLYYNKLQHIEKLQEDLCWIIIKQFPSLIIP